MRTAREILLWLVSTVLLLLILPLLPLLLVIETMARKKVWLRLTAVILILVGVGGIVFYRSVMEPIGSAGASYNIVLHPQDDAGDLRQRLAEAGLPVNRRLYNFFMSSTGADKHLQPGRYQVPGGMSHWKLAKFFRETMPELSRVTIPEGLTLKEIVPILVHEIPTDSNELVTLLEDARFREELDIPAPSFEGFLFPETYSFYPFQEPHEVVRTMVAMFREKFTPEMEQQRQRLNRPLLEIVTLASMIEAEAAAGSERELISSVFHNRLRQGMKLQCDPTVIYALGGLDRPLLRDDLDYDSPYNTYVYFGLPPGPIGAPGQASLHAALFPATTDYYYFVATGDGHHIFTSTLAQHNQAVARAKRMWRALRPR